MKIGIFLSGRKEIEGGGYYITLDIFENFLKYNNKKKNELFFLINNDHDNFFSKILLKKKLKYKKIFENKYFFYIKNFFFNKFPLLNLLVQSLNMDRINRIFEEEKCNLIYFISSEYRYPLKLAYISNVWDLQFKTHPEFSEVGSFFKKIYKNVVAKNFLTNSKFIITGTSVGAMQIKKFFNIPHKKIIKIPHPVSNLFFKKIKKNEFFFKKNDIKEKFFFYPANFWKHKNHNILIKLFEILSKDKNLKHFQLILVGAKKNNYNNIKKIIKNKLLEKKIIILDFVNRKELLSLYDRCEALVYPSFSGPENLPPLEAMARKKLVIISNYPGAKEQLGNLIFYFNPYKVKSLLKQTINTINILKNKSLVKKITNKNYFFVKQKIAKNYINKINNYLK